MTKDIPSPQSIPSIRFSFLVLALWLSFVAGSIADTTSIKVTASPAEEIIPGKVKLIRQFVFATDNKSGKDVSFSINAVEFSMSSFNPELVNAARSPSTAANLLGLSNDRLDKEHLTAAFAGGFFTSYKSRAPSGLVKVNGKEATELDLKDVVAHAIICFQKGAMSIVAMEDYKPADSYNNCLQNGPFLIKEGENVMSATSKTDDKTPLENISMGMYTRAFAGTDRDKSKVFFGATTETTLPNLATALLSPDGLALSDAINTGGSGSAGLLIFDGFEPKYTFGKYQGNLPNAIVVKYKK